jgi:hypothetical protein
MTHQRERSAAATRRWPVVIGFTIPMLFLIGLSARAAVRHERPPRPGRHIVNQASLSSAGIDSAANQLLMSVEQSISEDRDVRCQALKDLLLPGNGRRP